MKGHGKMGNIMGSVFLRFTPDLNILANLRIMYITVKALLSGPTAGSMSERISMAKEMGRAL